MTTPDRNRHRVYAVLVGVVGILIVLQGVWAGVFIREGKEFNDDWVEIHARGADLAILLSLVATVLAILWFRAHRELILGTAALFVLLVVEAYLGGLIGDSPGVEAVHFPIALALMGLAVWLPLRVRSVGPAATTERPATPARPRR